MGRLYGKDVILQEGAMWHTSTTSAMGGKHLKFGMDRACNMNEGARAVVKTSSKNHQNGYSLHQQDWQDVLPSCEEMCQLKYVASKTACSSTEHRPEHAHAVLQLNRKRHFHSQVQTLLLSFVQ